VGSRLSQGSLPRLQLALPGESSGCSAGMHRVTRKRQCDRAVTVLMVAQTWSQAADSALNAAAYCSQTELNAGLDSAASRRRSGKAQGSIGGKAQGSVAGGWAVRGPAKPGAFVAGHGGAMGRPAMAATGEQVQVGADGKLQGMSG
jgi:hypothetical protein